MSVRLRFGVGVVALALFPTVALGQRGLPQGPEALTLLNAVQLALEYHPAVGQANAQREAAAGLLRQTRADLYPFLSSEGSLAWLEEPSLVTPLHELNASTLPDFDRNLIRGNVSLSYLIFDGGARGARIERAEAGEGLAEAGQSRSRQELTGQVSAAYLGILSGQELLEAIHADDAGQRQTDGRPQGVAPANPIPENKHIGRVDTELGYRGAVGRKRHEVPGHVLGRTGVVYKPPAGRIRVGHRLLGRERLGGDHEQGGLWIQRFQGLENMGAVDIGNKVNRHSRLCIRFQGFRDHHRPQVGSADTDIYDVGNPLSGVSFPPAGDQI